jgi:hypothetical protein
MDFHPSNQQTTIQIPNLKLASGKHRHPSAIQLLPDALELSSALSLSSKQTTEASKKEKTNPSLNVDSSQLQHFFGDACLLPKTPKVCR